MDSSLMSPSAESPRPILGAGVKRRDTGDSITEDQNFETRVSRGDTHRGERRNSSSHHAPDSPPQEPYDPPTGYHPGDIAMQHMDDPRFPAVTSPEMMKGDYGLLGGNFQDDSDRRSLLSAKKYDHRESRKSLFLTGFYRLFVTMVFCVMIAFSLKGYEGFERPRIIDRSQVRIFNALMIGLSLALGLNLASSLKRYAVILRWSLLTRRYISLEVFDLILGLETLTKVGKLMIISLPGISKVKALRRLPWFREARDDGTKLTWIVCLLWILVNVGAQVLVASLSLFWPVDPSDATPLLTYGSVMVSDLSKWTIDPISPDRNVSAMELAWFYGNEAAGYPYFPANESKTDLSTLPGTPYYKLDNGHYEYRFMNRNPDHEFSQYVITSRKVEAKATCVELKLSGESKQDGENEDGSWYIMGRVNDDDDLTKYWLPSVTYGSISWIGHTWQECGPRCTNFTVYQEEDNAVIKAPSGFLCENRLAEVYGGEKEFTNLLPQDREALYGSDAFARIAAGAMAWTGYAENGWNDRQTRSYTRGSKWSPYHMIKKEEIEDMLARFTIGAVAAFDDHGLRYQVANQRTRPVQGQQVHVDWSWILSLLGGIILIQATALAALLMFANRTIIRDESFFSLAMLLNPVVSRIGKEGMNLDGKEIKNHPKLRWKRIRYDYKEGKDGEPNQIDIFFQGKDTWESRRSWTPGYYT